MDGTTVSGFDPATTTYSITKANDATSVNIGASVSDANATTTGTGTKALSVGLNTFDVVVTAEDTTTQKTYTLNITREAPPSTKGDEIQLLSRIVALADTYDAMSSNRSYRKALPVDVIIAEIEKNAGTQFDPELVEPFIEVIHDMADTNLDEFEIQ